MSPPPFAGSDLPPVTQRAIARTMDPQLDLTHPERVALATRRAARHHTAHGTATSGETGCQTQPTSNEVMSHSATAEQRTLVIERMRGPCFPGLRSLEPSAAPCALVGTEGLTLPHCEQEFRVGGKYRFCMRAPDGSDHWVRVEYLEIDAPRRLVFTWLREDDGGEIWCDTVVALSFEERDGGTLLTLDQTTFATTAHCDEHRDGWNECLDRLRAFVTNH